MMNLKEHIKIYTRVALLLVVLFSLSPCSAKEFLLSSLDLEYTSPVNKTRATVGSTIGCSDFRIITDGKSAITKSDYKFTENEFINKTNTYSFERLNDQKLLKSYFGHLSGSSPPKYILFKRLKLHLV